MKFKLGELHITAMNLGEVLKNARKCPHCEKEFEAQQKFPIKAAYWLGRFLRKAEEELGDYEKMRMDLCHKYCNRDEKGNPVLAGEGRDRHFEFGDEAQGKFNEELLLLREEEMEIPFNPLPLDAFGTAEFTPEAMMVLQPFIMEPETE